MMSRDPTQKTKSHDTLPCGRPLPVASVRSPAPKELLSKLVIQLNGYCLQKKLNRSEAREKILEVIASERSHFTAKDLLDRLQARFPEIGKATLYRNLPVLVESGVLQEGPHDQNGQVLYEVSDDDHHDHIVCMDCRRIFEFHDNQIEKRQSKVSSEFNFTLHDHRHVIYASCDFLHQK